TIDLTASVNNAAGGTCFDADDAAIILQLAPVAALTVTPTTGTAPLTVHADASASTVTDLPIWRYYFSFPDMHSDSTVDDIGPQTEPTADHTYLGGGTYTVTVGVWDTDGRWS